MMAEVPVSPLVRFNTFWYGERLSPLAAACLHSFVEAGHSVTLYAYDLPQGVPAGVTLADAREILPREALTLHRSTGSVTLFADRFRYEMIHRGLGAWIDCDMLCLKPILATSPYLFGWENSHSINNAILEMPPDAPLLDDLRKIFTTPRWVPPWFERRRRLRYKIKYLLIPGYGVEYMFWGTAGPRALTYYSAQHGVQGYAAPPERFYPVPFERADVFLQEASEILPFLSETTACIHLWSSQVGRLTKERPAQPGSFLARVLDGTWREFIRL